MDYFEGTGLLMAQIKEQNFPFPINVFRCNDFTVLFSVPLENTADLQVLGDTMNEMMATIAPEKGQEIQKLLDGTTEYREDGLIALRPNLSYMPENARLKPEETNFFNWSFTYILPGKEQALEEMAKKYKTLYQTKNIPDGFLLYEVIMGKEQPMYILVQSAKSPADYFSTDHSEALGKEGAALQSKLWSVIRKVEYKQAWIARDLSHIVKEKLDKN
jgi:hypothetical protein